MGRKMEKNILEIIHTKGREDLARIIGSPYALISQDNKMLKDGQDFGGLVSALMSYLRTPIFRRKTLELKYSRKVFDELGEKNISDLEEIAIMHNELIKYKRYGRF